MNIPRCDICELKDGHQNLTLIQCNKCELAVHKECYGMQSYTLKRFTCWACQAVGRSFEIEDRDDMGNRRRILQKHRPTKCALCNVSEGIHAMHPLYDSAGSGGRQLYNNGELAWAHTLCAFVLSIRSNLFGCARDGYYGGEDDDDSENNDERSENSELIDTTQEGAEFGNDFAPIHHFVYDPWKGSKQHQRFHMATKELRCSICGADDNPENVIRLCAQCNANDKEEWKEFKGKHDPSLRNDEKCMAALHVGCARWGGLNPSKVQRVYFFPGDSEREPVANLFCSLHASDVDCNKKKKNQHISGEGNSTPNHRRNSLDGSMQRVVSQSDRSRNLAILENQRRISQVIANQNHGSPNKTKPINGVASKPAETRRDSSKRRKVEQSVADDSDDEEEFEWEPSNDEADLQTTVNAS